MTVYYTDTIGKMHDIEKMSHSELIVALRRMCRLHQQQIDRPHFVQPEIVDLSPDQWDNNYGQDGF